MSRSVTPFEGVDNKEEATYNESVSDALIYTTGIVFSLSCYAAASLMGLSDPSSASIYWGFLFLAGLSLVFFLLRSHTTARFVILIIKFATTILVGIPLSAAGGQEELIMYALLAESLLYADAVWGSVFAVAAIAVSLMNQHEWKTWDSFVPAAGPQALLMYGVRLSLMLGLAIVVRTVLTQFLHKRAQLAHLEVSVQSIVQANLDLQSYAVEVEQSTTEAERKRVTREIHDIIGYSLTNQLMTLEASLLLLDHNPAKVRESLMGAREQIQNSLTDIRFALHELRASRRMGRTSFGELQYLCRIFQEATGVVVKLDLVLSSRGIEPELFHGLYRIIQQGLTNAFFHGRATLVEVVLAETPGLLSLTIIDNGRGASGHIQEGIGLSGIKERLEPFSGELSYAGNSSGFRLHIRIPRPSTSDSGEAVVREEEELSESAEFPPRHLDASEETSL